MLPNLRLFHLKRGMTRNQVIALLGKPVDDCYDGERCLTYYVGMDSIGIDGEFLHVNFDENWRLINTDIVQH